MSSHTLGIVVVFLLITVPLERAPRWERLREKMVAEQIRARGIDEPRLLDALRAVPRHLFVPESQRAAAYEDRALPIGLGQTISQPYIVAFMTYALELQPHHRVFELGTGSGYQAAIAARLASEVYTVEIVPTLARRAASLLDSLGVTNVHVRAGDGWLGWPQAAPFDRILVTAAAPELPAALLDQLAADGRLIMPLGASDATQELVCVRKSADGAIEVERLLPVRFVPVTGRGEAPR